MPRFIPFAPGIAILRIAFGLYWLVQGFDKAFRQHWLSNSQGMVRFLRPMLPRAQPFYRDFLQSTVLPHASVFSPLVALGELTAGVCLLLGFFVPVGALVAIWLNCNYMLLKGLSSSAGSVDRLFIVASATFILTAAGMVWGLDGVLWREMGEAANGGLVAVTAASTAPVAVSRRRAIGCARLRSRPSAADGPGGSGQAT